MTKEADSAIHQEFSTRRPSRRVRIGVFSAVFAAVILSNLLTIIITGVFLMPYIRTPEMHSALLKAYDGINESILWLSFLVPSIMSYFYSRPLLRWKDSNDNAKAKSRLLHSPLMISLISLSGWVTASLIFIFWLWLTPTSIKPQFLAGALLENAVSSLLCFSFSYSLLEAIYRTQIIPRFFPDNQLSRYHRRGLRLNILQRYSIYFISISVLPFLLIFRFCMTDYMRRGDYSLMIPLATISLGFIFFGALLTVLTTMPYWRSLQEMEEQTRNIAAGQLESRIRIRSIDELGQLSESMNSMTQSLQEKEFITETFGRIVDPRVRDFLLQGNIAMGGRTTEAAVLFSDIRSFTSISERLEAAEIVNLLNEYFTVISACIEGEGGIVNKYIGDAVMAVFGVPVPLDNPAAAGINAAFKMAEALDRLNTDFIAKGWPALKCGIGIHYGPVLAGNIGSASRMEYTVIGDTVNTAARIESACKQTDARIIASESCLQFAGRTPPGPPLDAVQLKGKQNPVELYRLL